MMPIQEFLTEKVLSLLAIDLGLIILLAWFFILLLILREFRKFAHGFTRNKSDSDEDTLHLCQQSVENALNYTAEHSSTLNDLIIIQKALEQQVSLIKNSSSQGISAEDQASIDELNEKLSKSHKLIRKLKGDLDKSVKGLRVTRKKLFAQADTVDSLKEEKATIEKEFEQLEAEYIKISKAGDFYEMAKNYQAEKKELLETIEKYKEQAKQSGTSVDVEAMKKQLYHISKEKDFIEQRYLQLLEEGKKE
ncbi:MULTISPECIES: chromosome partitioning protein ParA [unclassified Vibrio]|uniref:chromosome partitioning protein ParA n=1 Tax=unclassified Vibrio TaxID=2614977 RepID=UPI000B8EA0CB|nr:MULTISPECIES: chromosome partitioning protein ParA [unclassified Vibrio]NAX44532.1 chromosome partitioning protein ParA [Vibrio sp. V25_P4S6T154]OXX41084.1 chromosome partitioning protein ParA [Vibrio sp. V17_P4S1T151]OXX61331.1 chromosome partitioning protein ParA [Vibrio sp. V15_P4S5T153]OXX66274.1 chromosome partitioning protein ParA [Vibrio sp. V20_P4S3T152]